MFVFITFITSLLLLAGHHQVDAQFSFKLFNTVLNTSIGMAQVSGISGVESISGCALECLAQENVCEAFRYDLDIEMCYLGSWIWFNGAAPQPYPPLFATWKQYCDISLGYSLTLQDNQGLCAFLSSSGTTYTDSKTQCSGKQGRLLIIKTQIKKDLTYLFLSKWGFYTNSGSFSLWVGMERVVGQQAFVWLDQAPVSSAEMALMFTVGKPDYAEVEMCVVLRPKGLDDVVCNSGWKYLCEYVNPWG